MAYDNGSKSKPPSSPDSLEHGVRGRITGVTRIGPRALGIGAIVLFAVVALIMAGANRKPATPNAAVPDVAFATPNPQDTGHFGADEPIVAKFASLPARPASDSGLPPGVVLRTPAPSAGDGAATPAQPPATVPNLDTNAPAPPAAPTEDPALVQARQLKLARAQAAEAAREAQEAARRAELVAAQTAPVTVNPGAVQATYASAGNVVAANSTAGSATLPQSAPAGAGSPPPVPGPSGNPNAFLSGPFGQYAPKTSALQQSGTANAADYLDAQRYAPRSPYELVASSVIPAELITGIDSEQPGLISASVRQDVFDSRTGRYLLIPRGSKLIGVYKNDVQSGQTRILVAWERLIFPDTSSIDLHEQIGADTEGYSGLGGKVDNHFGSVLAAALLSSVISAGLQLSQPQMGTTVNNVAVPSTGQVLAGAVGQQVAAIGSQVVQKQLEIPPVIHVPRGYPFVVVVDRDMVLPGPYAGS
jgi:type IV secretion system protein VirB10